jgi:hypothetical protein
MKKNPMIFLLLIQVFGGGLTSCKKTDSNQNSLIGVWKSTKVDTLVHFITPVKPDTILSCNYKNCTLEMKEDSSFRMINSGDTITGTWGQNQSDSLFVTTNRIHGNFYNDSKTEIVNKNYLTVTVSYYQGHSALGPDLSICENTQVDVKTYYVRK